MGRFESRKRSDRDERATHITDQFRQKDSIIYDLKEGPVRLALRICQLADGWEIEAIPKHLPNLSPLIATGAIRTDVLGTLADAWRRAPGFPSVDWNAIRDALATVRAI